MKTKFDDQALHTLARSVSNLGFDFGEFNVAVFSYWLSSIRKNVSISGELDVKRIEDPSLLPGSDTDDLGVQSAGNILSVGADELHFEVAQYGNWFFQTYFRPFGRQLGQCSLVAFSTR